MTEYTLVPPTSTVYETLSAFLENAKTICEEYPSAPEHATLDWLEKTKDMLHHQRVYVERLENFMLAPYDELILYRQGLESQTP